MAKNRDLLDELVAGRQARNPDVRLSSVERYAATLGRRIEWRLAREGN